MSYALTENGELIDGTYYSAAGISRAVLAALILLEGQTVEISADRRKISGAQREIVIADAEPVMQWCAKAAGNSDLSEWLDDEAEAHRIAWEYTQKIHGEKAAKWNHYQYGHVVPSTVDWEITAKVSDRIVGARLVGVKEE